MADPALVELVISSDSDEAARARALRLLGFAAHLPVRVVAVWSQLPLDQVGILVCPARPVKAAPLADVGVILATTVDPARFPAGVRAGIGAAESPYRSWQEARTALRFTSSRQPVVHHDDLGVLALLAHVPRDAARDNADVAAIARMAGSPEDLQTLDAYCAAGSHQARHEACERSTRRRLGDGAFARAFDRGAAMPDGEAIAFVLERAPAAPTPPAETRPAGTLTRRELEIARLIAEGLTSQQIGARLFISERTVTTHVTNMLNKLGLSSRIQLASWMAAARDPAGSAGT